MSRFELRLGERSFPILAKYLIQNSSLFDDRPELYDEPFYAVESDVHPEDCQAFVDFLHTKDPALITLDNRASLLALS
jgi:hypothetical protein